MSAFRPPVSFADTNGWLPDPPLVSGEPVVTDLLTSKVNGEPVITVIAAEPGVTPQRYNIGVAFHPDVIQHAMDLQKMPEGASGRLPRRSGMTLVRPLLPPVFHSCRPGRAPFAGLP